MKPSPLIDSWAVPDPVSESVRLLAAARTTNELYDVLLDRTIALARPRAAELWVRRSPGQVEMIQARRWRDTGTSRAGGPPSGSTYSPSTYSPGTQSLRNPGFNRHSLPLLLGTEQLGRLELETSGDLPQALTLLTIHAGALLGHLQAVETVERNLLQTVTALAVLVESKDEYTEDHCGHIAEMSLQVGIRLGLPKQRLDQLTYAAILHDVGKVGVPDHVLQKRGPLTEDEWALMRKHPSIGRQVLERIEFLKEAAEIVEQHHERFDGTGYPKGLSGEAIRIEARIITVVDAFDAMTTTRPYRKALSRGEAAAELRRGAGRQFDPAVVEVFLRTMGCSG